jgi:hypothetical protein
MLGGGRGEENRWQFLATGDYHEELTAAHFEEWFHDRLVPNFSLNNAPYQSCKVPTMSSTKQQMKDWLDFLNCALKRDCCS